MFLYRIFLILSKCVCDGLMDDNYLDIYIYIERERERESFGLCLSCSERAFVEKAFLFNVFILVLFRTVCVGSMYGGVC